jgi:hypothetical protein
MKFWKLPRFCLENLSFRIVEGNILVRLLSFAGFSAFLLFVAFFAFFYCDGWNSFFAHFKEGDNRIVEFRFLCAAILNVPKRSTIQPSVETQHAFP